MQCCLYQVTCSGGVGVLEEAKSLIWPTPRQVTGREQGKESLRSEATGGDLSRPDKGSFSLQPYFPCQGHYITTEEEEGAMWSMNMNTASLKWLLPLIWLTMQLVPPLLSANYHAEAVGNVYFLYIFHKIDFCLGSFLQEAKNRSQNQNPLM